MSGLETPVRRGWPAAVEEEVAWPPGWAWESGGVLSGGRRPVRVSVVW